MSTGAAAGEAGSAMAANSEGFRALRAVVIWSLGLEYPEHPLRSASVEISSPGSATVG